MNDDTTTIDAVSRDVDDAIAVEQAEPDPVRDEERDDALPATRDVGLHDDAAHDAIERAAQAAIDLPTIPGRDEFLSLAAQARILSLSGAAPPLIRNNPHLAFHVALTGRDLGISPSAALELIDVIDTQAGPRLSLSPQLLNGQIRRLRLGRVVPVEQTALSCTARAIAADGTVLGDTTFTWEDAKIARLVSRACEPGDHDAQGCKCNYGYRTYPKRMLWWRAAGFCADDYFPEAGLGLYTAEELGAVVNVDGRPIDVTAVELPPGYDPPEVAQRASGSDPADADALALLRARIEALPDEQRAKFVDVWKRSDRLGVPLAQLTAEQYRFATSVLNAHEAEAVRGGWDRDAAHAAIAQAAQEAADGSGAPETTADGNVDPGQPGPEIQPVPGPPGPADAAPAQPETDETAEVRESPEERAARKAAERAVLFDDAAHVRDVLATVPPQLKAAVAEIEQLVKTMHHAIVDRTLREHGLNAEGPIDSRRMRLVACLVDDRLTEPF